MLAQTSLFMWYNKVRPIPIKAPRGIQRITIRIMIVLGVLAMGFFFWEITKEEYVGYKPLYYPLLFALLYMGLRLLYEWYHYWDISIPETPSLEQEFKVDVFTTFVPGEPYDMLLKSLEAIQAIEYPHTTYLCDEGNDPYLKEQCARLGVVHVYRGTDKSNAKAGNINHAIRNHAQGDICLILDPDHVPAPDFFKWVLPHFQNPEIGFVQVVQAYENIYENLIAKASAQQTFQFYGPIMMSMNKYGTAQAIGANCTFRREALDSIGGHAPGLAEDMHTSMQLHAKGWKSVYVPRVLSRGLVPNTISAYYKQQLKWSRGVFELLLSTYPGLFKKFTWRQKLHYGLLPWHYFMGFLFLINFLVPVISLFTARIPMQVGLAYFLSYAAPLLTSIIIIRHYVQKWVMEEDERGFHIQGGLIAIGTWWIHCLGFIYTILRRKVPYNPTPKDGQEENTLGLNIPNLAMGLLTIVAIGYGLSRDFNPYSLIMAGFASLNVLFIFFIFFASMQNRWRRYKAGIPWLDKLFIAIWRIKDWFWKVRHGSYQLLRIIALPVAILAAVFIYVTTSYRDISLIELEVGEQKTAQHFMGSPDLKEDNQVWFQEISFFSPPEQIASFLRSCSKENKYPYLQWKLLGDSLNDESFSKSLLDGAYNEQLDFWIYELQAYPSPLYLAPFTQLRDPTAFEQQPQLWLYLKEYFNAAGINNLMLVYSSPSPKELRNSFPNFKVLSFIEINGDSILASAKPAEKLESYLVQESFLVKMPWFLSFEQKLQNQELEFIDSIAEADPNFSGLLYKKSAIIPSPTQFKSFGEHPIPDPQRVAFLSREVHQRSNVYKDPIIATNYFKGLQWQNTRHPLFRRVIESDFKEMKSLGISHIYRYGPSIYNDNILKEAEEQNFDISYSFFIGDLKDFNPDNPLLISREEEIIKELKKRSNEERIIAWHLGGAPFNKLDQMYHPPELIYQRQLLFKWLDKLGAQIKQVDTTRPLSAELQYSVNVTEEARSIFTAVKNIDGIGVSFDSEPKDLAALEQRMAACESPLFIQSIGPETGALLSKAGYRVSFSAWQDDIFENYVSLNGLKSLDGYKKKGFAQLEQLEDKGEKPALLQKQGFKVIPLARAAFSGQMQTYTCLIKEKNQWRSLAGDSVKVDWYLAKLNEDGEPAVIKSLDEKGPVIKITLPANPDRYTIIAYLVDEGYTLVAKSGLNTPLYLGRDLYTPTKEEIEFYRKKTL